MYQTYETLLEIAKKDTILQVNLTCLRCAAINIRINIYRQILLKRIKSNFSVLNTTILSFKGISCNMYLIVY